MAPAAILLDLDGTLYLDDAPIPGAIEAVAEIRRFGIPFRFTTNTTRRPRTELAALLSGMGIPATAEEIVSAPSAAARWLLAKGMKRVKLLRRPRCRHDRGRAPYRQVPARGRSALSGNSGGGVGFDRRSAGLAPGIRNDEHELQANSRLSSESS